MVNLAHEHRKPAGKLPRHTSPAFFFSYKVFKVFYLACLLGVFTTPCMADLEHNINVFSSAGNVCVQEYDAELDYFPFKVVPDESTLWAVEYFNSYKVATNTALNQTYVLYQCGTPMPTDLNLTGAALVQYMSVPRTTLAVDETVPLTMLEILGYTSAIKYIANATTQYVTSPCIQRVIEENPNIALSDDPAIAKHQLSDIDLHIASPWGVSPAQNQLIFSATDDPGTLHRTEWIDFLSVFFNLEEEAGMYSMGVRNRYESLVAKSAPRNPKRNIAYITAFNGTYTIDEAEYKQEYMADAGGNPLKGGDFTNLTAFHEALRDADVIVDESYWPFEEGAKTLQDFIDIYNFTSTPGVFKFLDSGEVYGIDGRVNPRGWLDWYEGAVVRADIVLSDFVSALQTEQLLAEDYQRAWLRRLANETQTVVTSEDCPGIARTPETTVSPTLTAAPAETCEGRACNTDMDVIANGASAPLPQLVSLVPALLAALLAV